MNNKTLFNPTRNILWLLLVLCVLTACASPKEVITDTEVPPPTETEAPSATPVPSNTPLPTNTPVPPTDTVTPLPTATATILPTDTPIPSPTLPSILGTWSLFYTWRCEGEGGVVVLTFLENNRFDTGGTRNGNYTFDGTNITFTFPSGTKYTGIVTNNYMKGTMISSHGVPGCWDAKPYKR